MKVGALPARLHPVEPTATSPARVPAVAIAQAAYRQALADLMAKGARRNAHCQAWAVGVILAGVADADVMRERWGAAAVRRQRPLMTLISGIGAVSSLATLIKLVS